MLSRPFDAEEADFFQFETTAFEEQTYLDRIKLIQQNEEKFPDLRVEDGLLFKKTQFIQPDMEEFHWKLWIPEALTDTLIKEAHEGDANMHGGCARTIDQRQQQAELFIATIKEEIGQLDSGTKKSKPGDLVIADVFDSDSTSESNKNDGSRKQLKLPDQGILVVAVAVARSSSTQQQHLPLPR
ncbi:GH12393 [Drosophila grimshawi]|uniref:GH12393 n=1 Tax=Drosophila grimshawi TaxID=7222 RepID=B4JIV1_DROGR|nr:GH12393 [Drosophila grimshawi]